MSGMATVYGTAPLVHTTASAVHEQTVAPVAAVVQPQLAAMQAQVPTIAVPVAAPAVVATGTMQPVVATTKNKIEEEAQKKMAEYTTISHEEHMSISGSNARYMVMQKLSRKSEVIFCRSIHRQSSCLYVLQKRVLSTVLVVPAF